MTFSRRTLTKTTFAAPFLPRAMAQSMPIRIGVLTDLSGIYQDNPGKTSVFYATDDDAFGPRVIRQDGRLLHLAYLFRVRAPAESTGPWNLLSLVVTTPGEQAFRPLSEGQLPVGSAMITLTHLDQSRSERIIWLLEELGLPYELKVFLRQPDLYAPPGLKVAHVLGRAPIIDDDGVVLAESGAIVEYLIARHGGGWLAPAPDSSAFPHYLFWLHYAEGSLMLQLLREWSLDRMLPAPDTHPGMARVRAGTATNLGLVEARLRESRYFAGPDFTAADIMMAYPFTTFRRICPVDLAPYPAIRDYVSRLEERPAFRKATHRFA